MQGRVVVGRHPAVDEQAQFPLTEDVEKLGVEITRAVVLARIRAASG